MKNLNFLKGFILLVFFTSCKQMNISQKCGNFFLIDRLVTLDSIYILDPISFQEELWVYKEYFDMKENEILCVDTSLNGKVIRTFGVLEGKNGLYLISERTLEKIIAEGMNP